MEIVELTNIQFDEYAKTHPLTNYCQTSKYALVMTDLGYSYDYIGLVDENNQIHAASLILTKKVAGNIKYGYAPKGFLINYYDKELLKEFVTKLRKHYRKKNFIFIKFNPEINIGETTRKNNYVVSYNGNVRLIDDLKALNIKRRLELLEFELLQPKFSTIITYSNYNYSDIHRDFRKKVRHAIAKGVSMTLGGPKDIDILYNFMKGKTAKSINFFRNLYNVYAKDNSADLILMKVDNTKYLNYIMQQCEIEELNNNRLNEIVSRDPRKKNINAKINSDNKLQYLKIENETVLAAKKRNDEEIIAAALVIKHYNKVSVIASGFSDMHKKLNPNHILYYTIIERYKDYFQLCDLGGVSGNFEPTSEYHGLNQFKIKFGPKIYEFLGEFDLITSERVFKRLIKTSFIEDEFSK